MATSSIHPIKRIRESLKDLSELSGMRALANNKGFAQWLGCSESLIRNIENGHSTLTSKLAKRIENLTGVSSEWMLSKPAPTEPILDVLGKQWDAQVRLDPYKEGLVHLIFTLPPPGNVHLVPILLGKMIEIQMRDELKNGSDKFAHKVIRLLADSGFFTSSIDKSELASVYTTETSRVFVDLLAGKIAVSDTDAPQ